MRNRVNSPAFQSVNLRGSTGIRGSPSLRENVLVRSSDTFVADARNHPQAQFARLVEEYAQNHKKESMHGLVVTKIPTIEHHELRIKSYSTSSILETPISVGADVYTAVAYGLFGDATLGGVVRSRMVDVLRELANWLESSNRSDIAKIFPGITLDDLSIFFRNLIPSDDAPPADGDDDGAAGPADANAPEAGKGKGKNTTEQGMVVDGKKKKRKNQITRDSVRDQRYARFLRGLSNDIAHFNDAQGNYIHPISIISLGSMLYNRPIVFLSVTGTQVKSRSICPPHPGTQPPIYLATDEKDTSMIYMLVPQQELHTYDENQMFFERHVMETLALVPAYNEGEEEIMRTFMSFKRQCKEEVQLIFFVDGVRKGGADVNHGTLQALLNNFDFVKMGKTAPIARFGKDDLAALVADVCTLDETKNATAVYVGQDRTDVVPHIAIRVWVKKNNSGKKQSQLKFFEYLGKRCVQPRYLLFVDSDTRFEEPAVSALKDALDVANTGKAVPEIGGVTGEIIVENLSAGFYILGGTQYFEYKMSHHLGKRAESSFNRVSCLAGAFSMFECRALMDPRVIADFASETNDNSLWHYNKKSLGEDRYLTAQLLEAGYGTSFEPKALSSTVAPDSLKGFIAQRRRWDNSTLVNQIDLIFADKKSVFSLWGGRYTLPWVWNFIDFIFTLFMPGNMILLMVSLVNSILRLAGSNSSVQLAWLAPVVGLIIWGLFFLLPLMNKKPQVLSMNLFVVKLVSAIVVTATVLLFVYMYQASSIWLILIATWVFLGPYAITLILRKEVICMLCGPLFLLMTPVMFLFLKFYALANFGERSWGTRGAAAAEKEATNLKVSIGFAGFLYLLINVGYMVVAVLYPLYFMWAFSILVSVTAITRLIASFALTIPLGRYRRMLGTVGMFDSLFTVSTVVLFQIVYYFSTNQRSYEVFYTSPAVLFAGLGRAFVVASWYLGMRRSGWIAYGLAIGLTIVEGALILSLRVFDLYGIVLGLFAVVFTVAEGFLVWKTNSPVSGIKMEDNIGLCTYMAYAHNLLLLGIASIFCYLPASNLTNAREVFGETSIAGPVVMLPFAALAGVWMWSLHFFRTRAWVLVMNAICCNVIYLVALILVGELRVVEYMRSFSTGYYPYVALMSMIFQVLLSWTAVRWAMRIKHNKRVAKDAIKNRASVNPSTGSM